MESALALHRLHFAFTITYHYLFPQLTMGLAPFLASTAYIAGMLVGAAFALLPYLLPASTGPAYNLTIHNTKTGDYSLTARSGWPKFHALDERDVRNRTAGSATNATE